MRANCRLIVSPSPVPPNRRVVLTSAWTNGWNSLACSAAVMPTPVSTHVEPDAASVARPVAADRSVTDPWGVNLTALPIRLIRICRSRSGSVRPVPGDGRVERQPQVQAALDGPRAGHGHGVGRQPGRSAAIRSTAIPPASILDRSSTSLITSSRCWPLRRIDCRSFRQAALGAGRVEHQVGVPEDGRHRGADLVAHVGQEVALGDGWPARRRGGRRPAVGLGGQLVRLPLRAVAGGLEVGRVPDGRRPRPACGRRCRRT